MYRLARLKAKPVEAWVFAAAAFVVALSLRILLDPQLPAGFPFLTFFPAVILTTFVAGLWPGISVAAGGGLAAWYFFIPPAHSLPLTGPSSLALGFYVLIVAVDIAIIHVMNTALENLDREKARSADLAQQQEVLFSELQHRIANNLGVVSALLNLQRAEVQDEKARQALTEASTRLALIAKIQRKLHDPAGAQSRFGPFLKDLCKDVLDASGANHVDATVSAAEVEIPSDKMVPVALIVTEMISNALEHGFAGRASGKIRIDLSATGTDRVLTVADDGKGLPEGFSLDRPTSMGLRIVQSLARQIEGDFTMESGSGTTCRLVFPA